MLQLASEQDCDVDHQLRLRVVHHHVAVQNSPPVARWNRDELSLHDNGQWLESSFPAWWQMARAPQFLLQARRQAAIARCVVLADDPNVARFEAAAVAMMIDNAIVVIVVLRMLFPMTAVVVPMIRGSGRGETDEEHREGGRFHARVSSKGSASVSSRRRIAGVVQCKSVHRL